MIEYVSYQIFKNKEDFLNFIDLLKENNVEFQVNDLSFSTDVLSSKTEIMIEVKVDKSKLDVIDNLIPQNNLDADYYLYNFSDEELIDIIVNKSDWSNFDYELAKELLKQRGKEISEDLAKSIRNQRSQDLTKVEEKQTSWIIAGYIFAFLGGLISIFIGLHIFTHKRKLPNGSKILAYRLADRKHGVAIFIIGIIMTLIWIIIKINLNIN